MLNSVAHWDLHLFLRICLDSLLGLERLVAWRIHGRLQHNHPLVLQTHGVCNPPNQAHFHRRSPLTTRGRPRLRRQHPLIATPAQWAATTHGTLLLKVVSAYLASVMDLYLDIAPTQHRSNQFKTIDVIKDKSTEKQSINLLIFQLLWPQIYLSNQIAIFLSLNIVF